MIGPADIEPKVVVEDVGFMAAGSEDMSTSGLPKDLAGKVFKSYTQLEQAIDAHARNDPRMRTSVLIARTHEVFSDGR
jgi:hypothetical protein